MVSSENRIFSYNATSINYFKNKRFQAFLYIILRPSSLFEGVKSSNLEVLSSSVVKFLRVKNDGVVQKTVLDVLV